MNSKEVISLIKAAGRPNQKDLKGMARYGINTKNCLCISMPALTKIANLVKKEPIDVRHQIALDIWETGIREARILAGIIDVPELVNSAQMESWVKDFDSWDVCDNTIMKLFSYTPLGWEKAVPWSQREKEFEKRAGFVLMAMLGMHDKKADDERFYPFFNRIKEESTDERNFVKKAINWALRQIGKSRNKNLYQKALSVARELSESENKTARWIGRDAFKELSTTEYVLKRFN